MLINCKEFRKKKLEEYKSALESSGKDIKLAIVQVGSRQDSTVYVRNKIKTCADVGIKTTMVRLSENISVENIKLIVRDLNNANDINGILIQLPIDGIDKNTEKEIIDLISPEKDVDCLTTANEAKLYAGNNVILPCTVQGIVDILKETVVTLEGETVAIVGRSNLVGKPLIHAMLKENATPIVIHSKTPHHHKSALVIEANIIISATGINDNIDEWDLGNYQTIIDVGINRDANGKLRGDLKEKVKEKAAYYTSVPGGIGTLTTMNVVANLLKLNNII